MSTWNIEKHTQLAKLQAEYNEFYSNDISFYIGILSELLQIPKLSTDDTINILKNATEIRAILRDWDRTVSS